MRHLKARHGLIWYQGVKTLPILTIFIYRGNYYEGKVGLDPRLWIMSLAALCLPRRSGCEFTPRYLYCVISCGSSSISIYPR